MLERISCIALRTVKYNDRNSILGVYTHSYGRLSLLLPAGTSRAAVRLRALTMPLGRFECVADIRPGRDIFAMRDVRPTGVPASTSPVKSTLSLFTADLLASLLREPQQDTALFGFLWNTIDTLAEADQHLTANFHICLLMRLQQFLGIEPDWSTFSSGAVFDMADGIFRITPPVHGRFLPSAEAEAAYTLRRISFRNASHFAMSRSDRNLILDRLLQYYRIHFPSLGTLSSLDVLRAMFDF